MATGDESLVTVCIATKDRCARLPNAIDAVLAQTHQQLELFVVDDGSTDDTQAVVTRYRASDSRVRPVRHDVSRGLAASRNEAVANGRGTYFTFLDDDDLWDREFIGSCVEHAQRKTDAGAFCTGYRAAGAVGGFQDYVPELHLFLRDAIEAGYTPPVAAQFYRMSPVVAVGGYDERIKSGVDHDLWLRLAASGVVLASVPRVLAYPDTNLQGPARMTTDFSSRRAKIARSLELWRPTIEGAFSPGFFGHFTKSYEYAIARKEIAAALSRGRRLRAVLLALGAPFKGELFRFVMSKLSRRTTPDQVVPLPPSFPPYQKAAS